MKRLFAVLIVIAMLVTIIPLVAVAEDSDWVEQVWIGGQKIAYMDGDSLALNEAGIAAAKESYGDFDVSCEGCGLYIDLKGNLSSGIYSYLTQVYVVSNGDYTIGTISNVDATTIYNAVSADAKDDRRPAHNPEGYSLYADLDFSPIIEASNHKLTFNGGIHLSYYDGEESNYAVYKFADYDLDINGTIVGDRYHQEGNSVTENPFDAIIVDNSSVRANAVSHIGSVKVQSNGILDITDAGTLSDMTFEVCYGGKIKANATSISNIVYNNRYIDTTKSGYNLDNDENSNTTVDTVTATTSHCKLETSATTINFESLDKSLITIGWNESDLNNGGGFEVIDGNGYRMPDNNPEGLTDYSYCVESDQTIKIKVLPKYGYAFDPSRGNFKDANGNDIEVDGFETLKEAATYALKTPTNNIHMADLYIEEDNRVVSKSDAVAEGGAFELEATANDNLNGILEVTITDSTADESDFVEKADDGYELAALLDVNVNQVINGEESWNVEKTEFENKATVIVPISNELASEIGEDASVEVIRDHEGEKEVLEGILTTLEDGTPAVAFQSDKFSTFAILYSEGEKEIIEVTSEMDPDVSVEFEGNKGSNWIFEVIDYLKVAALSDEEFEALGMGFDRETFNGLLAMIKGDLEKKSNGTFVGLYDFNLINEDTHQKKTGGPFTVKIKMNDEMKKYNTFSFYCVDNSSGDLEYEGPYSGKVEGDYLVATLPHFSTYGITGSYVEQKPKEEIANTLDDTDITAAMLLTFSSALALAGVVKKRKSL